MRIPEHMTYVALCLACVTKFGGKPDEYTKAAWRDGRCNCCGHKGEVVSPAKCVWR